VEGLLDEDLELVETGERVIAKQTLVRSPSAVALDGLTMDSKRSSDSTVA
jgi:hypothetical protein